MNKAGPDLLDIGWRDEPAGFSYILGVIKRQILVLIALPILCLGLGLAYLILEQPLYTATASLQADIAAPTPAEAAASLETYVELIRSDRITAQVIDRLDLDEIFSPQPSRLRSAIADAREALGFGSEGVAADPQSALIRQIQGGLDVRRIGATSIITVSYTSADRPLSVDVANAFAGAYVADVVAARQDQAQRRVDVLQRRADEIRGEAAAADTEAQRLLFQSQSLVTSADDLTGRLAEIRERLAVVDAERAELGARFEQLSPPDAMSAFEASARQSEAAFQTYSEMTRASEQIEQLRQEPGGENVVARLEDSIAEMRESLESTVRRLRNDLQGQISVIDARRQSILDERDEIQTYAADPVYADLIAAQRRVQFYEGIYQTYLTQLENAASTVPAANIEVVSQARAPVAPSYPDYRVFLVLALIFGLVLGSGIAMFREWTRKSPAGPRGAPSGRASRP